MGVRGNSWGVVVRDYAESGFPRANKQTRRRWLRLSLGNQEANNVSGLGSLPPRALLGLGAEALMAWRVRHSVVGGHFFQPLEKQRADRVVKQKQRRPGST